MTFYCTNHIAENHKFDKNALKLRCLVKLPNGQIVGPVYSNGIQNWQLKILDISDHCGHVDGKDKKGKDQQLFLVCSYLKCKKEDLEVHFMFNSFGMSEIHT